MKIGHITLQFLKTRLNGSECQYVRTAFPTKPQSTLHEYDSFKDFTHNNHKNICSQLAYVYSLDFSFLV